MGWQDSTSIPLTLSLTPCVYYFTIEKRVRERKEEREGEETASRKKIKSQCVAQQPLSTRLVVSLPLLKPVATQVFFFKNP